LINAKTLTNISNKTFRRR